MKVNIEDVLFWMDAIRNSEDRYRTLESFWKGQVNSKIWLTQHLKQHQETPWKDIVIHGGWNGVLASIIFNSDINVDSITSVDIDPVCENIARTVNKKYEMEGRFEAVTMDMCKYTPMADVVINTSCEHITQNQYDEWLDNQSQDSLIVLQSNNYFELDEHIRCANDLDEFTKQSKVKTLWKGEFETPKYTRYMIIGKKNV